MGVQLYFIIPVTILLVAGCTQQLAPNIIGLGDLCSGNGCDSYCREKSLECEEYCIAHPENSMCQERFSFVYKEGYISPQIATAIPSITVSTTTLPQTTVKQFKLAEPQPWVPDVMTQSLPLGASSTRLTLPAPLDKISFSGLGAFGSHQGGHVEGLDHEWIDVKDGTPIGSWGDGEVIYVQKNNPNDTNSEWRIHIDYGDGLIGEHMEVKTPLVKAGEKVKTGQPVAFGNSVGINPGYHSAEFNLVDLHRRDSVLTDRMTYTGAFVSPFDYLQDSAKEEIVTAFTKQIIEPYISKGKSIGAVTPWEPYLTNPLIFHNQYKGKLAGEWFLISRNWSVDSMPDMLILLPSNTKYYNKQKIIAIDEESGPYSILGDWEADYYSKRVTFQTETGTYYGIFELNESGTRATLKLEYETAAYPTSFTNKASTYVERNYTGRREDAYGFAARSSPS